MSPFLYLVAFVFTVLSFTDTAVAHNLVSSQYATQTYEFPIPFETVISNNQSIIRRPLSLTPCSPLEINGVTITANTSVARSEPDFEFIERNHKDKRTATAKNTTSTFLVIARDTASAYSAYSGLNDYGIPYEILVVPANGTTLPVLNASATIGNYGGIVILSEVSYADSSGDFVSALTSAQWTTLFNYQLLFGVRMVRLDVVPSSDTGTSALGDCCADTQEQNISISDTSSFPTSGLVEGAPVSTLGLWHYPASISNSTIATSFATFGTTTGFTSPSVAGVINNFSGRRQMVFFTSFATDWSSTSNLLQHAWIHWASRGLYAGYRRMMLNTQVDDMFLTSPVYDPSGNAFRIRPADLAAHISWMASVNSMLPAGSNYTIETGHNGNGNIGVCDCCVIPCVNPSNSSISYDISNSACGDGPISYNAQTATDLEFVKPLGTGTNLWPSTASTYPYSLACVQLDALQQFWANTSNLNAFSHISHTFTHESEDNATYYDVTREISWNQAWLNQTGIANANRFSSRGLIPPAITGLHNGDALRAWSDNGIINAVGDNTRPVLLSIINEHWPLITTVTDDNFAGIQITPRWATNIYYNCDTTTCDVAEWIAIASGNGTIADLLALEKSTNVQHLLALHHDPFMFHQANLRQTDVETTLVNGVLQQYSLLQMWVETVLREIVRIVDWPIISLKHDDLATKFAQRMARDNCAYSLTYILSPTAQTITGVQISAENNKCSVPIPVTVPGTVTDTKGFVTEQIGSDPLTIWVVLNGEPVEFELSSPVDW